MRKLIFLCLLFFAVRVPAQVGNGAVDQVRLLMEAQEKAWNRGDIVGFMEHYWHHDSLKFVTSKRITYGWQSTLDNYKKSYPDKTTMGRLSFTIVEATALSDSAVYVIGKWNLYKEKPAAGHFTLLWRLLSGKWVIVSDHTS